MLELRPTCECCRTALPPESPDARICTYECTWCRTCAEALGACPNCGGNLTERPVRPEDALTKDPASTTRVERDEPCPHPQPR